MPEERNLNKTPNQTHPPSPDKTMGDYGDEKMINAEIAKTALEHALPNLHVVSIEQLSREGLNNVIFLVNGNYIFRFPRHKNAGEALKKESRILPELQTRISVQIPKFEYIVADDEHTLGFVGYKKIEGEKLTRQKLEGGTGTPNPSITKQIATFFNEMHSFDLTTARSLGVKNLDIRKRYMEEFRIARERLYPILREHSPEDAETIIQKIEKVFHDYLSDDENFHYDPKLLHRDLGDVHTLIDSEEKIKIIDFGSMEISDPDYDLWRPYSQYGRQFIEELLKTYPHNDPERLFHKMEFFWTAQAITRVLRAKTEAHWNDPEYGIPALKKRILGK
jgi:aminoglycoside 2''-phosphotransferase